MTNPRLPSTGPRHKHPALHVMLCAAAILPSASLQAGPATPTPLVRETRYVIQDSLDLDGGFNFRLGNFGEATRNIPIIDGEPYDPAAASNPGWWINGEFTKVPVARDIQFESPTHHYVYQGSTATLSIENARAEVDFGSHSTARFDNSLRVLTAAPQDQGKGQRDTFYYLFDQPPYWSGNEPAPWHARFSAAKPHHGPYTLPSVSNAIAPLIDPSEQFVYANEGRTFQFRPTVYGSASGDSSARTPFAVMDIDLQLQVDHLYRKIERPVVLLDFAIAAEGREGKLGLFGSDLIRETGVRSALRQAPAATRIELVERVQSIFDAAKVPVLVTTNPTDAAGALKVVTVRFGDEVNIPCNSLARSLGYCDRARRHLGVAEPSKVSGASVDQFDQDSIQSVRVFAQLDGSSMQTDLSEVAATIAHEVAHTYGATHLDLSPSHPDYETSIMNNGNTAFSTKPGSTPVHELPLTPQVTHNPVYHMRRWAAGEDADYLAWDGLAPGTWEQVPFEQMTREFDLIKSVYNQ